VITVDTRSTDLTVEVTDTNGFPLSQKANTTLSSDDATRTFTITPTGADFHFYERGEKFEIIGADSVTWTDVEGEHWFYYNNGVLTHSENPTSAQKESIILNNAFIAYIYWNATSKKIEYDIFEERHGIGMAPETHLYEHLTRGSQYISGIGAGDVVADGTGALDTHAQFSVTSGVFRDEDIRNITGASAVGDTIQVGFITGVGADFRVGSQTGFGLLNFPAGRLYYNFNNAGTWELAEVPNNDFVLYHLFATNGVNEQLIMLMGQNTYTTVSNARAGATTEISNIKASDVLIESVPIATFIFQTSSGYANTVKARIRTTDTGEDFIDWRTTELAQGTTPSSHANLTNLQLAGTGVTYGHISDQAQDIYGVKNFVDGAQKNGSDLASINDAITQAIIFG